MERRETPSLLRVWRVVYPLLTYDGIVELISLMATILAVAWAANGMELIASTEDYWLLIEEAFTIVSNYTYELQTLAALITLPILALYDRMARARLAREGKVTPVYTRVAGGLYLLVVLIAVSACYVGNNLVALSGISSVSSGYTEVTDVLYQGHLLTELLGLCLIIPVTEELIFRGLMYARMKELMPLRTAAILCSFCFGLVHGNLVQGIYSFALGLLMIYLYERYHDLRVPILFHMLANLISVLETELGFLDVFYESWPAFIGSTVVMLGLLLVGVYLVEIWVHSEELVETE